MHPTVKEIRKVISPFRGAWVRRWRDGEITVSMTNAWARDREFSEMREALHAAGWRTEMNGQPGTSGSHCLEIKAEGAP
ncbi:MAG: hypothetical protein AAF661_15155 [Pseudomonadota bacterium]